MTASNSSALDRRWLQLCRRQQLFRRAAIKRAERDYMSLLREKIPGKTREKLEWAFGKAFALVFEQGRPIIEKTYSRDKLSRRYIARDLALAMDGDSEALRYFDSVGRVGSAGGMLLTTVEGVGLGALGIGMPDIVLFVSVLLRGVYETALQYGFSCDTPFERLYILSLLECAMLSGWDWEKADAQLEAMGLFPEAVDISPEASEIQLQRTASAFTTDLLILKFIQGMPIVGLIGGLGNPVYYRRVMSYAELKYQRRYVALAMQRNENEKS